jgi:hypothetical protein
MSVDVEPKDKRTNCAHWLHLAQDRDQWRTVQNTAMELFRTRQWNLIFYKMRVIS